MNGFIKIHPQDNLLVALKDLSAGDELIMEDGSVLRIFQDTPLGHKIALTEIPQNQDVIKYGAPIGYALKNIQPGEHLHTHNIKTKLRDDLTYSYQPEGLDVQLPAPENELTFDGFVRKNGEVGIRNELWIVPTVGCVNAIATNIKEAFLSETIDLEGVEHVEVFGHNYGCSQLGDDHENTKSILANIVSHPNAAGVLVLGLGCENNQVAQFKERLGEWDADRVKFLISQDVEDEEEEGLALLKAIFSHARKDKRQAVPVSKLKVGLECGGSDAFSGITANPLLGHFSDWLIGAGGTTVLTEVPEMFGAETILMNRCVDRSVFDKTVSLINNFKSYFRQHNQPIYENPSPGNKEGGISTLEDKSLGCTMKGGNAPVQQVYDYGQRIDKNGLVLYCSPGNDMVATTALASAGCQLVLFTTGRGTPFGGFVPTMKIATNTPMAEKKKKWIDFNAGTLLDGQSMESMARAFQIAVLDICNGKKTKNEEKNFRNMSIWKSGVTL